jgi:oxygen-independent coproporphyrinogen III oxidase
MLVTGEDYSISIYIHIPFCTRKCPYCHFYVLKDNLNEKKLFLKALTLDWKRWQPLIHNHKIISIYLGGGTPSLMTPEEISSILELFPKNSNTEITLELNPENADFSYLQGLVQTGINRLSIGVQAFQDHLLQSLKRTHGSKQAQEVVVKAYNAGLTNLSIDLMYDLPGQTLEDWRKSLQIATSLPLSHLSLYNLTLEEGTPFYRNRAKIQPLIPSPEQSLNLLEAAIDHLEEKGLKRYEISAFSKENYFSRHNIGYWTGRPFIGLGPSAWSFWNHKRLRAKSSLQKWINALETSQEIGDFQEELSPLQRWKELFILQMRLVEGVSLAPWQHRYGSIPLETERALLSLEERGFIKRTKERISLTQKGFLFYDSLAAELV